MGYYLRRERDPILRYGMKEWPAILNLARAFGWEPSGTTDEAGNYLDRKTYGSYLGMDNQTVSDDDAGNIADALERALIYFPGLDEQERLHYQVKYSQWRPPDDYEQAALNIFILNESETASKMIRLKEFIVFCREGSFIIC